MPGTKRDARIQFLDTAARYFHGIVPETSAHLMHQRNVVAEELGESLKKAQTKDICEACGMILVPGSSSKISAAVQLGKKKRKSASEIEITQQRWKTECLTCHRTNVSPLEHLQGKDVGNMATPVRIADPSPMVASKTGLASKSLGEDTQKSASANASSRKRAKARKQGSLQALLEKSRGADSMSGGLGLDLMDLMKKT